MAIVPFLVLKPLARDHHRAGFLIHLRCCNVFVLGTGKHILLNVVALHVYFVANINL